MARLGEFLVKEGLISETALAAALAAQEKTGDFLGAILLKHGAVDEEKLVQALERQSGSPLIDLERIPLDPKLAPIVPFRFAETARCVPVRLEQRILYMGAADPTNVVAWDELAAHLSLTVRTFTVRASQLPDAWRRVYGDEARDGVAKLGSTTSTALKAPKSDTRRTPRPQGTGFFKTGLFRAILGQQEAPPAPPVVVPEGASELERLAALVETAESMIDDEAEALGTPEAVAAEPEDSPTINFVTALIEEAVKKGASDIHIEPFEKASRVRFRVDGALQPRLELSLSGHRHVVSRIKVMAEMDISERRLPQDGRIRTKVADKPVDLRVSSLPIVYGEKIVIRVLGGALVKEKIDDLGMKPRDLERLRAAVEATNGMLLVTGPTGSGKTTTLYTILRQLNQPDVNISTAEDPIEYEQMGIAQVHVKPDIDFTFAAALRSFLRQDPDIIMVGEIRDLETAEVAIKAALTGHLVLSTLHTNDSIWTIARLLDMGVQPFLVAAAVRCVVAQRLLRKLCPKCKQLAPGSAVYEAFKKVAPDRPRPAQLYVKKGCSACAGIGYKGRAPVFEVFSLDKDEVKKVVTEGAKREVLVAAARQDGMRTLVERALDYVEDGTTSLEEAWSCCAM